MVANASREWYAKPESEVSFVARASESGAIVRRREGWSVCRRWRSRRGVERGTGSSMSMSRPSRLYLLIRDMRGL